MSEKVFLEVQKLGLLIRNIREERGMSVNDLAESTNLSRSVISKFERGQTDIQLSTTVRILSSMSLTLDDLCSAAVFSEFDMIELAEKAYRYTNDLSVLTRIHTELTSKKTLLKHERIFKSIIEMKINNSLMLSEEVVDYFENLEKILTFDAYLTILVKPFIQGWLVKHINRILGDENTYRTPVVQLAWEAYQ